MKRLLMLALVAAASVASLHAQAVDATVCNIVKNPVSFNGKTVRVKGVVFAGFDSFVIKDPSGECGFPIDSIWLDYPQGTKAKAGPVAVLHIQPAHNYAGTYQAPTRAAVVLDKSKDFKQFDSLASQAHTKGTGMCLGCARSEVTATFIGRIDAVADAAIKRDAAGKITDFGGFGNMNMYPARLVLQSVSEVSSKEIDYSAYDSIKIDAPAFGGPGGDLIDPLDTARKIATGAGLAGTPTGTQAERAIGSYGKHGEHNGVVIAYSTLNEVKDESPAKVDSPDGVLYTAYFSQGRLQGDALVRALYHIGEHVADLRTPPAAAEVAPPFILEFNGWSMSITTGVVTGQKLLGTSGGAILWNLAWPVSDRQGKMETGLNSALKEAAISR